GDAANAAAPPQAAAPSATLPPADASVPPAPGISGDAIIARSTTGDIKYRDRRLLVLYFDMSSLPPGDLIRAYSAANQYLGQQMQASDLVALMAFQNGAVRVKLDFTGDRARLQDALEKMIFGEDTDGDGIPDQVDTGTAFGQDDAEFNIL